MPSPNKYRDNSIDDSLVKNTIEKIVCYTNNIPIINIVSYPKKTSIMANFRKNMMLSKKYFYFFSSKKNGIQEIVSY